MGLEVGRCLQDRGPHVLSTKTVDKVFCLKQGAGGLSVVGGLVLAVLFMQIMQTRGLPEVAGFLETWVLGV